MSKASFVAVWLLAVLVMSAAPCAAQAPPEREPPAGFARHASAEKGVVFYAPGGWTRAGEKLELAGPGGAALRVIREEVPEGYSLKAYVAATLRGLRGAIGDADPPEVRRARMSGLEAREVSVETLSPQRGRVHLRLAVAVRGPAAVAFVLVVPDASAAAADAAFLAAVESAAFVGDAGRLADFESSRGAAFAAPGPAPLAERQALVRAVDGTSAAERAAAVARLAAMCRTAPGAVADLLLDERPVVRAAAVYAIPASGVAPDDGPLFFALRDADPLVMAALRRAIELDGEYAYDIADDEDLAPLAGRAGFKRLVPNEE